MKSHKDTLADLKIKACINRRKNFAVVAGAGSGKTGSLIKALEYIRCKYGKSLRAANQQVACITYTNVAVENIKRRTNLDELFSVSTIHSFLWALIENYQSDICNTLKNQLIPERIEKKRREDNGGRSVAAQKAREQVVKLQSDLENLQLVEKFSYDDSGRQDYSKGSLNHDDIVDLVCDCLICKKLSGKNFLIFLLMKRKIPLVMS